MATISLAKALKLKNRLAGRLSKVQEDIVTYNSVLIEQAGQVDVATLFKLRDEITDHLIALKTKIVAANTEIQGDIIRQGEIKSKLTWIGGIPIRDGKERHGYQNTEVVWTAYFKKKDLDETTKKLEAEIDMFQDKIDAFNHTQKITVADRTLDLAS